MLASLDASTLVVQADECSGPQCVAAAEAQNDLHRANVLELLGSAAALDAYKQAISRKTEAVGIAHTETQSLLAEFKKYLLRQGVASTSVDLQLTGTVNHRANVLENNLFEFTYGPNP